MLWLIVAGIFLSLFSGGCRMLPFRSTPVFRERPPTIVTPEDSSPSIRHAAAQLASLLQFAYDIEPLSMSVDREESVKMEDKAHGFYFMLGFCPPSEFSSALRMEENGEDSFHYRVERDAVYFYGSKPESQEEPRRTDFPGPALDLAVYRFLEEQMGFRWLLRDRRGVYFPPHPQSLRVGAAGTVRPVVLPYHNNSAVSAETDCFRLTADFRRSPEQKQRALIEFANWLRYFAIILEVQAGEPTEQPPSFSSPFLFPGHETRLIKTVAKDGLLPVFDGLEYFDWGLADFALYCLAKAVGNTDRPIDFSVKMADFTAGMGEAAEPVKEYFRYWRQVLKEYDSDSRSILQKELMKEIYSEQRLRESGDLLFQAQTATGMSKAAAFRVENLRLGHEHLSLSQKAWKNLTGAMDEEGVERAVKLIGVLKDVRQQLLMLTSVNFARLTENEFALGDMAGIGFIAYTEGLTPLARVAEWRYKRDCDRKGEEEKWFALGPGSLREWEEYDYNNNMSVKAEETWFAAVLDVSVPEQLHDQARLAIWGFVPGTEVFFNGRRIVPEQADKSVRAGSAVFNLPADSLAENQTYTLVLRFPEKRSFMPARAVWFMAE